MKVNSVFLFREGASRSPLFSYRTTRISWGERDLLAARPDGERAIRPAAGTRAEFLLHPGIRETYERIGDSLEQTWILEKSLEEVRQAAKGSPLVLEGEFTLRRPVVSVRYSRAVVRDAGGRTCEVEPSFSDRRVRLCVPGDFLQDARLPIVIDPLITPEFTMDTPVYALDPTDQSSVSAASNGTEYFVVWSDGRTGGGDIYGVRLDGAGTLLDPSDFAVATASNQQTSPSVTYGAGEYFVVWRDARSGSDLDVYGTRVATDGTVRDPAGIPIMTGSFNQTSPAVAYNGTVYLVVWQDDRAATGVDADIYGRLLDSTGNPVAADFAISTAANQQKTPSVATDGSGFLVVWEDQRSGTGSDIYGARVNASGTVLDPGASAIPVCTELGIQTSPKVAFDTVNNRYMAVWQDSRTGNPDIYGARVTTAGTVVPNGSPVYATSDSQQSPAVAFDGTNFAVAWMNQQGGNPADIWMVRMDASGVAIDAPAITVSTAPQEQALPAVASGQDFLVAWTDSRNASTQRDIFAARVRSNGTVRDPTGLPVSQSANRQRNPSAAFDGTNFLAVWSDDRNGDPGDIYGTRLDPGGTVLDPSGIALSAGSGEQSSPDAGFDGTNYFVVWEDRRNGTDSDLFGARVSAAGAVLDPGGLSIVAEAGEQTSPGLIFDGIHYFLTWIDTRAGTSDVYGAILDTGGNVQTPGQILIYSGLLTESPRAAFAAPDTYLVVWDDFSTSNFHVFGKRVDATDGTVLDPAAIAISGATGDQMSPSADFDGTDFLVVWSDSRSGSEDIVGSRVATAGTVLDPAGIPLISIAGSQSSPSLVFNGTDHVLSWLDGRQVPVQAVYATRIDTGGAVLDGANLKVSAITDAASRPLLCQEGAGGERALVVYGGFLGEPFGCDRVIGAFFSTASTPYNIRRVDSPTELPPGMPDGSFPDAEIPVSAFPFVDPDNVLDPVAEFRILFYEETTAGQGIVLTKTTASIQIDPKP